MINSLNSNYSNLNIQNKNLNPIKESNLSKPNSNNLINSVNDKASAVNKILGYGVDKDGYFTSDFNEAAGLPKDYKIYAKGAENFVKYQTTMELSKLFTSIDLAKSVNRAYQVFSQLIDEPNGNFTSQDIDKIPQYFQWNDKTLKVTKIYTKDEYLSKANARTKESGYSPLKESLSFPDWEKLGDGWLDKKTDILKLTSGIDIGKNAYTKEDGSISKGGVLMAFLASNDSSSLFLRGETTIWGKWAGVDDNFNETMRRELDQFLEDNPIIYALSDDLGAEFLNELRLQSTLTDVNEFKKQWLEMKAKSDAMGEKYKAQIAEQNSNSIQKSNESTQNPENKKPFKPIQGESKNKETYKDNNIRHEFLKKLLKNSFNQAKELEILLGMKMSDDENFDNFLLKKNLQSVKSVDIKV